MENAGVRYLCNSCVNTVRPHFPWRILHLLLSVWYGVTPFVVVIVVIVVVVVISPVVCFYGVAINFRIYMLKIFGDYMQKNVFFREIFVRIPRRFLSPSVQNPTFRPTKKYLEPYLLQGRFETVVKRPTSPFNRTRFAAMWCTSVFYSWSSCVFNICKWNAQLLRKGKY